MFRFLIWGTGEKTKELLEHWENGEIVAFVDSYRKDYFFMNKPVILPNEISNFQYDGIIITPMSPQDIVDLCERLADTTKTIIVLYCMNIKKWNKYVANLRKLDGFVNRKWLEKIVENQGVQSKLFSPEIVECYINLEYFHAMKRSLNDDNRIHLLNVSGKIERFYDIGKKLLWNQRYECWQVCYCNEWILFPASWNKKKCALIMREWMEKNEEESPVRSYFEADECLKNIVMVGDDILLSAVRCANANKTVYLLDKQKYEMLKNVKNIVLLNGVEEIPNIRIDAARIDVSDANSMQMILKHLQNVERIECVSYYSEIEEYLSTCNYYKHQSGYVYYPILGAYDQLTNSVRNAKTTLHYVEKN